MSDSDYPVGEDLQTQVLRRQKRACRWSYVFQGATLVGIIALVALLYNIVNGGFGLVVTKYKVPPDMLMVKGVEYTEQEKEQLVHILEEHLSKGLLRRYHRDEPLLERDTAALISLIEERVMRPKVLQTYPLKASFFERSRIEQEVLEDYGEKVRVEWRSWVDRSFVSSTQSSKPLLAGIRTALYGSLWTILVTIAVAFPLGIGAAIYLEEYADNTWLNRIIQVNINNLAGVPSIIYGILGLAVFVRAFEPFTSGTLFGAVDPTTASGRTIFSAGLTLALLVLPLLIINGQEALKAVPASLREAGLGLGGTKWQTIWSHVLPGAMPGILTGTILSISRAVGETAPLVVIGASTFIAVDPDGLFSKFTTLPVQIYQWTSRPQPAFRNLAAAAILILLVLLLSLNAFAIIMRNHYRKKNEV